METKNRIDAISNDVVELGTVWAKLGLSIGRQALEASAKSLTKTAALLGQIADAVDGKKTEGEAKGAALSLSGAPPAPCPTSCRVGRARIPTGSANGSSPRSRSSRSPRR